MATCTNSDTLAYLTIGEGLSGVLQSQVLDVLPLLRRNSTDPPAQLISLLSLRDFRTKRRELRDAVPDAVVLPMAPGARRWRWNRILLRRTLRRLESRGVVCRGPVATALALASRSGTTGRFGVCFDGRGARSAEIREYVPDHPLARAMPAIEREAVVATDFRIAVSERLVEHWRQEFQYDSDQHVVIPCSLSLGFEQLDLQRAAAKRRDFGWTEDHCVLAYSGSAAGWQSSELLSAAVRRWLQRDARVRVLFLSRPTELARELAEAFPGRVKQQWVSHAEVPATLAAADYGLLLREQTVTNRVAAPVKCAEYLACGLAVLCSQNLGDYSEFVQSHGVGQVVTTDDVDSVPLPIPTTADKRRIREIALTRFGKSTDRLMRGYRRVVAALTD